MISHKFADLFKVSAENFIQLSNFPDVIDRYEPLFSDTKFYYLQRIVSSTKVGYENYWISI